MRFGPLLVCAALALLLCSCEETADSSSAADEKPQKQTTSAQPQPVAQTEPAEEEKTTKEGIKLTLGGH